MNVLGIDIGGSGIKGAIVNTRTGKLVSARHRIKTPDAIIAATAMIENACLVTRDQDLLDKVPEVRSLNPFGRNP